MKRTRLLVVPALVAAGTLALAACAPEEEPQVSSTATVSDDAAGGGVEEAGECAPAGLDTLEPGVLTVGTDTPAYPPWFVDNDPTNGQGYESAVAYAVADQMGYPADLVQWVSVPFSTAIAPGPKTYDIDVNQFTITEERRQAVDFTSPYYEVSQVAVTTGGSPAEGVTDLEGLRSLRVGAQVGTTSWEAAAELLGGDPATYNTNDDAKVALENGQIDVLVVDLPPAVYSTAAELEDGVVVGQIPSAGGQAEEFGVVLDLGSPLTSCVSAAVDALAQDGTLADLQQEWLADVAGAPVLE